MTTRDALYKLLNDDETYLADWLRKGYSKDDRRRFRFRLEHDQLTIDEQEELLKAFDFSVMQEKLWNKPQ